MSRPTEILTRLTAIWREVDTMKRAPSHRDKDRMEKREAEFLSLGFELAQAYLTEVEEQTDLLRRLVERQ